MKNQTRTISDTGVPKKLNQNKLSKFQNIIEEPEKENNERMSFVPTQPKKLNLSSKFGNFQNVLAGRMSLGGSVFTMPEGGIKSLKEKESARDEIKP